MAQRHGPETVPATMEQRRIQQHSDPTEPVPDDTDVELDWVREDERHATTLDVAAAGDLTPDEAVRSVAAALGFDDPDDDVDDDYDH